MKADDVDRMREQAREIEARADAVVFGDACKFCGVGPASIQGRGRDRNLARRRAFVAWMLREEGWSTERVARVLQRTDRQVRRMINSVPTQRNYKLRPL